MANSIGFHALFRLRPPLNVVTKQLAQQVHEKGDNIFLFVAMESKHCYLPLLLQAQILSPILSFKLVLCTHSLAIHTLSMKGDEGALIRMVVSKTVLRK